MYEQKIVLASSSPRRIAMMKEKGYHPIIFPSSIEEKLPFPMDMKTSVLYLALKKALDVEQKLDVELKKNHPIILAADTIVYADTMIGKPKSEEEAFQILSSLRNTHHFVATGVVILRAETWIRQAFCEVTKVFLRTIQMKC